MSQRYLRMGELATRPGHPGMLPVNPVTIWRWVRSGRFPAPVNLGPRINLWRAQDVQAWLEQRERAAR